jgi:hypothetical protein
MSALYQRLSALALASVLGGCAPLVSYDGFRDGDAGASGEDAAAVEDARTDARGEGGPDTCTGIVPGTYCGRALPGYVGGTQDVVRCLGNGTTGSIKSCPAGCSSMPDGREDLCDPCAGQADGPHCVHELVVDYPFNDVLVTCAGSQAARAERCGLTCTSSVCR